MNRVYKTRWSVARQQYVVTDEEHASKGKASKSVVALAVAAAAALTAGVASAAYIESGFVAQSAFDVEKAKASWETAEYQKDWGLGAMNASSAYALGFHGQDVAVGVMDSGALLQKHSELAGERFHASQANGVYGSTGNRYQVSVPGVGDVFGNGDYKEGEAFDIDGNWISHVNDTHGTHVTGTVGANRDGSEFHGVAWGSDIWVGNTGGTDNTNYGLPQDYNFFHAGWSALADNLVSANGERGGVINNSFGTNLRIDTKKPATSLSTNTTAQTEYEYFLFKQNYGDKRSFVDAAYDAVKDTNVVQVMTTGNRDMDMPYYRALYPYFNPEAEKHWIAVAGLEKEGTDAQGNDTYKWVDDFNQAGNAKWWTVVAPGDNIYSSIVYDDHYENTSEEHPLGSAGYASYGGTSMAAPHVTGAMGVLMSRYESMSAIQVRDILFTTARHTNKDGSTFTGWTVADGQVDPIYGWGLPDLEKGMYGPGQLLGNFDYNLKGLDVWTNDISQVALNQRKAEDEAWMKKTENGTKLDADEYELGKGTLPDIADATIDKQDAEKWRAEYYEKRANDIQHKLDNGLYNGSLVKSGEGTLVMTGTNTYEGTTTVKDGKLLAFGESIGKDKTVTVEGGTFGVISGYYDNFTLTGAHTSTTATDTGLTIDVREGAALYVSAAGNVTVDKVILDPNAKIVIGIEGAAPEQLAKAYTNGDAVDGTFTTRGGSFDGFKPSVEEQESAFFKVGAVDVAGNKISTNLVRKDGVTYGTFARTANERAIAQALETQTNAFAGEILSMTGDEVSDTYASLSDDMYSAARNALVVNSTMVTRAVIDQARGFGEGRAAELENGRGRIWATGIGFWGNADGSERSLDVDFRAGFLGGEVVAHETTKLGAFFGYGSTDYKGDLGKIDGDDIHYGIYGLTDIGAVSLTYGVNYTTEDRDSQHLMGETQNAHSEDATVLQAYAEAAYKFNVGGLSIDPYLGFAWARVETDGFSENLGSTAMSVKDQKDDIQMTTLGARFTLPFTMGTMPVALKADAGWTHYFGDTESITQLQLGAGGNIAQIQGQELKDQFNLGLGVNGQVAKNVTVGVSYTGSFGTDTDTHGVIGNVRFAF